MFKEWANTALRSIQEGQQRRADFWILQNMSDKELRDIGISRTEIRQTVYGKATN
jgi:uncharacterized protein YjiS (DUF1127 family)